MSRRSAQTGSISISGDWWRVRFWMDVPGQENRVRMSKRICPVSGPGVLTESERSRKAKRIVAEPQGSPKTGHVGSAENRP